MTKTKLKTMLLLSLCCLLAFLAAFIPYAFTADAYDLTLNIFTSRQIKMEEGVSISADSDYSDSRKGLRMTGGVGAYAAIHQPVAGAFDIEFVPEKDILGVTFHFTETATGETFTVAVGFGSSTVSAYVECKGEKAGLYYFGSKGLNETTAIYNSVDIYTQYENPFTAAKLSFDPAMMTVKLGDYTVWGLKNEISDGRRVNFTLDSFEEYTVSMSITGASSDEASLLVYAINGQKLDQTIVVPSAAPRIFANFRYDGVLGEKYTLPEANVYDLVDGALPASACTVTLQKGTQKIALENGAFVPETAGEYTVLYKAENEAGFVSTQKYTLTVRENFGGEYAFDGALPNATLGNRTLAYFPAVEYRNAGIADLSPVSLKASVFFGEEEVKTVENAEAGFTYAFAQTGEYTVVYTPVHEYYGKDTFQFTVVSTEDEVGYTLSSAWREEYTTAETVLLPTMTMHTPAGDIEAKPTVRFPDGGLYSNARFNLSQEGTYEVIYTAEEGENVYEVSLAFEALTAPSELFTVNGSAELHQGEFSYNGNISGLVMETELGSTITYNKIINLNEYAYNKDKDSSMLFELILDPYTAFYADLVSMDIVLTDLYDPTNYVTITITQLWEAKNTVWSCVRAGHAGQPTKGLEGDADMENNPLGKYNLHVNQAGFLYNGSMSATPNSGTVKSLITTQVWFDYEQKAVFAQFDTQTYKNQFSSRRALVIDLDHTAYFDTPWEGFTTGECILTINPTSYTGTEARFVVCGMDRQNFSNGAFRDETAPEITVYTESADGSNEIPYGVVGKEYPFFDAVAVDDLNGVVSIEKKVYYYYHGNAYDVTVGEKGFTPEIPGEYEIVYTATDRSGNQKEIKVPITVQPENYYTLVPIGVTLESGYAQAAKAGERVAVAAVESTQGGAGRITCQMTVTDGQGQEVAIENGYFRPLTAGNYTVSYALKDFLGESKVQTYAVEVVAHDGVIFEVEELYLPTAILTGIKYRLPEVKAIDFSSGVAVEKTATVSVKDENGNPIALLASGELAVIDKTVERVTVVYACPGTTATKEYDLPVQKTYDEEGVLDFTSYFYGVNASVTQANEGVLLTSSTQGASVEFLKSVLAETMQIAVRVDETSSGTLNAFSIVVKDAKDPTVSLRFTIKRDGDGATVSLNGGKEMLIAGSFTGTSGYALAVIYQSYDNSFKDKDGNQIALAKTCENGKEFVGFPSGEVSLSVIFEELTGEAGVRVEQVNKQFFFADNRVDTVYADTLYSQTVGGNYLVGDVIVVPSFKAVDVLGNVDTFVRIRDSLGGFVEDSEGNLLNNFPYYEGMQFTVTETGGYNIQLIARDYILTSPEISYNTEATEYVPALTVNDRTDPTFTVNGSVPTSGSVGDTIQLPTVTATDNGGAEGLQIMVFWIGPDSRTGLIKEDFGDYFFRPDEAGTYTIKYVVMDEYFNYAEQNYTIVIK